MRLSRQDVRLAARSFARQPGFTITAVLSLALAIALNTTMYSVLDAMINPDLHVKDADRLTGIITWGDLKHTVDDATRAALLREGSAVYEASTFSIADRYDGGGVEYGRYFAQVSSAAVAPNYFQVLGRDPLRGRLFDTSDVYAPTQPVLITERLAETLSPDEPFPVGATVRIDGEPHPVIGILPSPPGRETQVYRPASPATPLTAIPPTLFRLKPGISLAAAEKAFRVLSTRLALLAREDPKYTRYELTGYGKRQFHLVNFHYALIASVAAVLLIACGNLANLQLARGISRSRELALRSALGASRRDIITQLVVESALLCGTGLLVGLVLTYWGMHVLKAGVPPSVANYNVDIAPQVSWRLFAFAMIACALCTVVIGLYPAVRVSRVDPNDLLKSGAGTGANKRNRQQYGVMVAAQIGLALALLSGAAIVVRTALHVRETKIGFDPRPIATAWVVNRAPRDTVVTPTLDANALIARLRSMPSIENAAYQAYHTVWQNAITVDEQGGPPRQLDAPFYGYRLVTPGYMRTMGLRIVKGRDFIEGGVAEEEAIVDQLMATRLWPGIDPIGRQIKLGEYKSDVPWVRVVGVVANLEDNRNAVRRDLQDPKTKRFGDVYLVASAARTIKVDSGRPYSLNFVVRAKSDPERLPILLRQFIPRTRNTWLVATQSMESEMFLIQERQSHDFVASMFVLFATMAVGLAALGIYGIVNHTVAERKRELGVRLALGATPRNIIHAVIRDGNPMALAGVAIGLYLIKRTVFWLHVFSMEGDEYDVFLFAGVAATLFLVALVSAMIPALRATRIDPVESLRCE